MKDKKRGLTGPASSTSGFTFGGIGFGSTSCAGGGNDINLGSIIKNKEIFEKA